MKTIDGRIIDFSKLKAGDIVVTGGSGLFSYLIKRYTYKDSSIEEKKKATHVGIVVEFGGQKFIAEMIHPHIRITPFSQYENSDRRWIIDVVTHSRLTDSVREEINGAMAYWYRKRKDNEYDWKGVLGFVPSLTRRVEQAPKKWFCSEMASHIWRVHAKIETPKPAYFTAPSAFTIGSPDQIRSIYSAL